MINITSKIRLTGFKEVDHKLSTSKRDHVWGSVRLKVREGIEYRVTKVTYFMCSRLIYNELVLIIYGVDRGDF